MLVIRLRTISSETFSTCPIFKFWTLPSCTCSPCRCLHSASIVSASSRSIVVCAESVEQHQLICLLCVILHVFLPCPFIALTSLTSISHTFIHTYIVLSLVHLFLFLCFFFSHFPSTPFLLPLDSSTFHPFGLTTSFSSSRSPLWLSYSVSTSPISFTFSPLLLPFLLPCLAHSSCSSFSLLFSCRAPSRLPCTSLKCSSIFRLYLRLLLTLFRFFPPILLSIFPFSPPPRPVGHTPIVNYRRVFPFLQ